MEKTFWIDPYKTNIETTVVSIDNNQILFDKTIAYSFAGGQESDTAYVNGIPIINSKIVGNEIYYTLPNGHGLLPGNKVTMTIDWLRRSRLMRLHFAAELVLEIVTQSWKLEKVGAHIAEHKARIDFKFDTNISTLFDEILATYNNIITKNLPIQKGFSDPATGRRFWKIDGFAQVPCGGTHVDSTAEVGFISLKRDRPGKGIERIEIHLRSSNYDAMISRLRHEF